MRVVSLCLHKCVRRYINRHGAGRYSSMPYKWKPTNSPALTIVLASVLGFGCDPGIESIMRNTTDTPVTIYFQDRTPTSTGLRLGSGAISRSTWMIGTSGMKIQAYDTEDSLIFCRIYSNKNVDKGELRIGIQRDVMEC